MLLLQAIAWCLLMCPFVVALVLPSCTCCVCTTFFTDTFGADDIANYTQTGTATWAIAAGRLSVTNDGSLQLISANTGSTSGHGQVSAKVQVDTVGASAGVVGAYTDSDNYIVAYISGFGGGASFRLAKRVAGVESTLSSTSYPTSTGTDYTITLCWDGTCITASVDGPTTLAVLNTATGNYAGMRTSGGAGSVASFDDFTFKEHSTDNSTCPTCPAGCAAHCTDCSAHQLQVVVSGSTNDLCANCSSYNATYTLDYFGPDINAPSDVGANSCRWGAHLASDHCGINEWIAVWINDAGDIHVEINDAGVGLYYVPTGTPIHRWLKTGSTVPCLLYSSTSIPVNAGLRDSCHEAGTSCLLTTL